MQNQHRGALATVGFAALVAATLLAGLPTPASAAADRLSPSRAGSGPAGIDRVEVRNRTALRIDARSWRQAKARGGAIAQAVVAGTDTMFAATGPGSAGPEPTARVLVRLDAAPGLTATQRAAAPRSGVTVVTRTGADALMARLGVGRDGSGRFGRGAGIARAESFRTSPLIAMDVTRAGLERLLADGGVRSVVEDLPAPPALTDSVRLVAADALQRGRIRGNGTAIAILDTGVDADHPMLDGRVVAEACFSTRWDGLSTSLCPGGASESAAPGSAEDCADDIVGCGHGTHVAGIAVGRADRSEPGTLDGMAPDTKIVAIQVFSRFTSAAYCGEGVAACALSYASDQIRGLERVLELAERHRIAAVNLSLGGGRFTTACDDDPRKPVIDALRAAGVATVAAAGNGSHTDGVSAPACISSAIAVGATDLTDRVAGFSNDAPLVDLLAPGVAIASAYRGGYARMSGTSMATPHVAGAIALLRQVDPTATVDALEAALERTGVPVTDARTGLVHPRLDVRAAAATFNPVYGVAGVQVVRR